MKPIMLVTGDVVLDCHLYGALTPGVLSVAEPGTTYSVEPGGAALTSRLLDAAADAGGRKWEHAWKLWQSTNAQRKKAGQEALPFDFQATRPEASYAVHLGLDISDGAVPAHPHSYSVWIDRPVRMGSTDRVWRVEQHFGYSRARIPGTDVIPTPIAPPASPILTFIDDSAMLFRHERARQVWPDFDSNRSRYHMLKMSWPLSRGDLWAALKPVRDQLIVVVSAADLRREDVQISHRLSWEQSAENTRAAFQQDPTARELLQAAHVILNFGSAGAFWVQPDVNGTRPVRLLFDPQRLEGDYEIGFEGTAYGFQTCMAAGLAHHLMLHCAARAEAAIAPAPVEDAAAVVRALEDGIKAGLMAQRRLLELGHGPVSAADPRFPFDEVGQEIAGSPGGFVAVSVPLHDAATRPWTILAQSEFPDEPPVPLVGLAHLTARYGVSALSHVPALKLGSLFTVDRAEIESLRTLDASIRAYEATKIQKRPLSIGVFGPPGAGKSHGVKALAFGVLGSKLPFLEFNLSQFKGPDELVGAFHRVRDAVLGGVTPVAFWDEFDSQHYKWLQYLLAPMQDGGFQDGQITHPIGKCIFIFAGGTSDKLQSFGVPEPPAATREQLSGMTTDERTDYKEQVEAYLEFKLLKGPDFISRLDGFLNVLGPNPLDAQDFRDVTWPIRRAVLLRGLLGLGDAEELNIDPALLHALVSVPKYTHGVRSFEKIVRALAHGRDHGRLHRAALPPEPSLARETDPVAFRGLIEDWNPFKN